MSTEVDAKALRLFPQPMSCSSDKVSFLHRIIQWIPVEIGWEKDNKH